MKSVWKAVVAEWCRAVRLYRGIVGRVVLGGVASLLVTFCGGALILLGGTLLGQLMLVLGIGLLFAVTIDGWRRMFYVWRRESARARTEP